MQVLTENVTDALEKEISVGMISAGGCGANQIRNVLRVLPQGENIHLYMLALNTDVAQLKSHFKKQDLVTGDNTLIQEWINLEEPRLELVGIGETGMGAGGDPAAGAKIGDKALKKIRDFMGKVDIVIIIGGAGKGTGSGAMPVIAQMAADHSPQRPPLAIVTMARKGEGWAASQRAKNTYKKLLSICPTAAVLNDNITNLGRKYTQGWEEINTLCLLPILLGLREISLQVGDINVDPMDWWNSLKQGRFVQFGRSVIGLENRDNMELVAAQLMRNPYQDHRLAERAERVLLWLHGGWSMQQHEDLIQLITNNIQDLENKPNFEITSGLIENPGDNQMWALAVFIARESPDADINSAITIPHRTEVPGALGVVQEPIPAVPAIAAATAIAVPEPVVVRDPVPIKCNVNGTPTELIVDRPLAEMWNKLFTVSRSNLFFKQKVGLDPFELQQKIKENNPRGLPPDLPGWCVPQR